MSQTEEKNLNSYPHNLNVASDFCSYCGNILELPLYGNFIVCNYCNYKCNILDYKPVVIISKLESNDKKKWVEQYRKKMNKSDKTYENEEGKKKLAKKKQTVISQECPKCHHPEMYFFTMQMRSADEGTTVFYECVKCGYKTAQNN